VSRPLLLSLASLLAATACGARSSLEDGPRFEPDDGGGGSGGSGSGGAPADCREPAPVPASFTSALRLHYPFEGTAENLGSEGPAFDGVVSGASFVSGMGSTAVQVGAGDFVSLPGSASVLSSADALTIALWFLETNDAPSAPLFDCRSFDQGLHIYRGVSASSLTTCWGAADSAFGPVGCESVPVDTGDWHHLIFRRSEGAELVELFVDGAPRATLGEPGFDIFGPLISDVLLGAGNLGDFDSPKRFLLDEVRVYGATLDDATQCEELVGGRWCDGRCAR